METDLPTVYGKFRAVAFENNGERDVHLAMVMGDVRTDELVLVRVHTENVTCDMFGSTIDDTGYHFDAPGKNRGSRQVSFFISDKASTAWFDSSVAHVRIDARARVQQSRSQRRTGYGLNRDYVWRANPPRLG